MRAWRFADAAQRYDQIDENKFRRALEQALQQVSVPPAGLGGSGSLEVDNAGAVVSYGVNDLNFSNEFVATVTQAAPTVIVGVSLATTQPSAHTWSADQTFSSHVIIGTDPGGTDPLRVGGNIRIVNGSGIGWGATVAAHITGDGTPQLRFGGGVTDTLLLTGTALNPNAAAGLMLGTAALPWGLAYTGQIATTDASVAQVEWQLAGVRKAGINLVAADTLRMYDSAGTVRLNFILTSNVAPQTTGGLTLGTSSNMWGQSFLAYNDENDFVWLGHTNPVLLKTYSAVDGNLWIYNEQVDSATRELKLSIGTAFNNDRQVTIRYVPGATAGGTGVLTIGQFDKNIAAWTHTTTQFYTSGLQTVVMTSAGLQMATGNIRLQATPVAQVGFHASGSLSAASGYADAFAWDGALTATANNDFLAGFVMAGQFSGASLTNVSAAYLRIQAVAPSGSITTQYGIEIDSIAGATTNYAIYTHTGPVSIGDATTIRAGGLEVITGNVGLGVAPLAYVGLYASGNVTLTNSSTHVAYGVYSSETADSTITSEISAFYAQAVTAAAVFTVASAIGLHVANASKGAGSTITNLYGVYVDSMTTGATNYAIYTNTGTVQFGDNVIANGTGDPALNLGGGTVGSTTFIYGQISGTGKFRIQRDGTISALSLNVQGGTDINAGSSVFGVANTGNVGVGVAPITQSGVFVHGAVLTGNATQVGVDSEATYSSAATFGAAFYASIQTAAAAFTMTTGYGLYVADAALGAGSAITTQYGLYVASQTKGGTNYAIYTNTGQVRLGDDLNFYSTATGVFDHTMTRFGGGAAPAVLGDVWSYDTSGGANKWRPRFLQVEVKTGVLVAAANGDGTFSVFAFDGRALSGTSVAGPTPTVTAVYGGFIVDMGMTPPAGFAWDVEWTNSANGNTGGPVRITSQEMVFQFFSNNSSVPFGTTATTFQFKVSQTGGTAAVYGTASTALAASTRTEVNAYGLIVASQIACVNLAAISADLGVCAAGVISDAIPTASQTKGIFIKSTAFETSVPSGWLTGIFFSGANPPPVTVTGPYIDFTATGTNFWLKGPSGNFTVDASGNVVVSGTLKTKVGNSTAFARVNGVLAANSGFDASGNTGGDVAVKSYTLKASSLVNAGDTIRVVVRGRLKLVAQTGTTTLVIKYKFATVTVVSTTITSAVGTTTITFFDDCYFSKSALNTQLWNKLSIFPTSATSSATSTATESSDNVIEVDVNVSGFTGTSVDTFVDNLTFEWIAA